MFQPNVPLANIDSILTEVLRCLIPIRQSWLADKAFIIDEWYFQYWRQNSAGNGICFDVPVEGWALLHVHFGPDVSNNRNSTISTFQRSWMYTPIQNIISSESFTMWLIGVWLSASKMFAIPTTKRFKWIWLQVGFECPNHLWVSSPLNVHS